MANSSNTNLVPNANITLGGSGTNRALMITPATNQFGATLITLTVSDGLLSNSTSFVLTVTPVNDPPTLDAISDIVIDEDSGLQTIALNGISSGAANESQTLSITASNSNAAHTSDAATNAG